MKKIQDLLLRIAKILEDNDEKEWSIILFHLYEKSFFYEGENYDHSFVKEIMSLYAGMGSLNDIVLQKDGKPLMKENEEFYRLKHELFEKCIEMRTSKIIENQKFEQEKSNEDNGQKI